MIHCHLFINIAKKQLIWAFVILSLQSCSGYRVTSSDLRKADERYSSLFYNTDYRIKFHSYGGRHLVKRLFFRSYGKLVFTYNDKLRESRKKKGNDVLYSLFIIQKIPDKIRQKNDTMTAELYYTKVIFFNENYKKARKNTYKRYFTVDNKNYLFIGEYKRFYKDDAKIYQYHMSQEMQGLEL